MGYLKKESKQELEKLLGCRIGRQLGGGGNARVYLVERNGERLALKVLKRRGKEALARFTSEVEFHHKYSGEDGVLPMLDVFFPEDTGSDHPPSFLMPYAVPVREALGEEHSLRDVVEAVFSFASTLSRLAEKRVWHRDIKPQNLFRLDDKWVIGDFGLVRFPEPEERRDNTRGKLGSSFYIAPEMINTAKGADGEKADVYSLAKTLWVLATGQSYPVPGTHDVTVEGFSISLLYPDQAGVGHIEVLLERCTRFQPNDRPSMSEVAYELEVWLNPSDASFTGKELSVLGKEIRQLTATARQRVNTQEKYRGQFNKMMHVVAKKLEVVRSAIDKADLRCGPVRISDNETVYTHLVREVYNCEDARYFSGQAGFFSDGEGPGRCVWLMSPKVREEGDRPVYMWCGLGIDINMGGECRLFHGTLVRSKANEYAVIGEGLRKFVIGSAVQEKVLDEAIQSLLDNLPEGLEQFARFLEE